MAHPGHHKAARYARAMRRAAEHSGRGRVVLGVVLGVVLTAVLPALATADAATPATAGVVLAVVALLVLRPGSPLRAARTYLGPASIGEAVPLVLVGRATDPVHHPLRPRAPGHA